MLPIGKFLEPNYGKLLGFFAIMAIIFYLFNPLLSVPCYYGSSCKFKEPACVASEFDALSSCEKTKTFYSIAFSISAYLLSCCLFLGYKLLRKDAYSYYYEQT